MMRIICAGCALLLVLLVATTARAQTRPGETATGTISGRVTAGGKPLAGITIALQPQSSSIFGGESAARVKTDADGKYQFTGVAAGSYQINPLNFLYILPSDQPFGGIAGKSITLSESENATNVDLALVRGGVVTGKVTDAEGRPLIAQYVQLERIDARNNYIPIGLFGRLQYDTDDRGIYRLIGVPPGRYRVSAGEGDGMMFRSSGRKSYPRTFHPDVTDASQATLIEVADGGEVTGVDIRLGAARKGYAIAGRVVDAETGEPAANTMIYYRSYRSDGLPIGGMSGVQAAVNGEFRFEGIQSGKYGLYVGSDLTGRTNSTGYSDTVQVEVIDGDVTGVELRVKRGGSLSGIAVIEGTTDPSVLSRLAQQRIIVSVRGDAGIGPGSSLIRIGADGSFRAEGLRPGRVMINHMPERGPGGALSLLRIERDGAPIDRQGIEIGSGDHITGVRLVLGWGNGSIRGQVVVTNGTLPEGAVIMVLARRIDGLGSPMPSASSRIDARGYFLLEGLAPGEYELRTSPLRIAVASAPVPQPPSSATPATPVIQIGTVGTVGTAGPDNITARQTVTVANGQTVETVVTLDLSQRGQNR